MQVLFLRMSAALFALSHLSVAYYIVTTTVTIDLPPFSTSLPTPQSSSTILAKALSTTPCTKIVSNATTTSFKTTTKIIAAASTTSGSSSSASSALSSAYTSISLPPFPLSQNTTTNLNAFLQLILSIPESVFEKGDAEISSFFSNIGACMSSGAKGLETDLTNLAAPITSFVTNFATNLVSSLENGAKQAGSGLSNIGNEIGGLFGRRGLFSDLENAAKKAAGKVGGEISNLETEIDGTLDRRGLLSSLENEAKKAAAKVEGELSDLENEIGSELDKRGLFSSIENALKKGADKAKGELNKIGNEITDALDKRSAHNSYSLSPPSKPLDKRDSFTDLLTSITNIQACMSNIANNNTLFDIGRCALDIAELTQPEIRFAKIKTLVMTAGGVVKVLEDLRKGTSAETAGKDSLAVLDEALGIQALVTDCKFVVEQVISAT
jgi:hypothetical protein